MTNLGSAYQVESNGKGGLIMSARSDTKDEASTSETPLAGLGSFLQTRLDDHIVDHQAQYAREGVTRREDVLARAFREMYSSPSPTTADLLAAIGRYSNHPSYSAQWLTYLSKIFR